MQDEVQETYQVFVTNIVWRDEQQYRSKYSAKKTPPSGMTFDIPRDRIEKFKKSGSFENEVESYIYNTLSGKFGREVGFCQVWLPLK